MQGAAENRVAVRKGISYNLVRLSRAPAFDFDQFRERQVKAFVEFHRYPIHAIQGQDREQEERKVNKERGNKRQIERKKKGTKGRNKKQGTRGTRKTRRERRRQGACFARGGRIGRRRDQGYKARTHDFLYVNPHQPLSHLLHLSRDVCQCPGGSQFLF